MKTKQLVIILLAFGLLLGGALILYRTLGSSYSPTQQLAQQPSTDTSSPSGSSDASNPGKTKAWDITFYDAQDAKHKLSDFEGKPVVLSFWADWCSACKGHMPYLHDSYLANKDVHFIMLNIPNNQAAITRSKAYLNTQGYTFPFYHDIDQISTYTYSIEYFPTTFFIDSEGYLAGYYVGQLNPQLLEQGLSLIR